ncbi:MAG: acetyl-CoA carboxylase carboxyltransferase subunit alpha [Brevinematales bacterium]|nr:acetyl-CoA carboxylase carboxyltransferase subunit alpha [Brevinematales bacterium]
MRKYYLDFEKPIQMMEEKIAELKKHLDSDFSVELREMERKLQYMLEMTYKNLTPWQISLVARHPERPIFSDYRDKLFDDFLEIHGDRNFRDDPAIITGFATLGGYRCVVIGEEKGKGTKDKLYRNFGMPQPEGYRKALRAMKLAEKFGLPVLTFVDTAGAYPGMEGEERGQGEAIARNLFEMSGLKTQIVATVIGEGGSGGALAIAVADRVLMLENAIYSVISPESCASILWRDASKGPRAAEALKLTAPELLKLKVIDEILPEPIGGAHRQPEEMIAIVRKALLRHLDELVRISIPKLVQARYQRFRGLGVVQIQD